MMVSCTVSSTALGSSRKGLSGKRINPGKNLCWDVAPKRLFHR